MLGRPPLTTEPCEKYIGHDNNRDSYMLNGIESRIRQRVWREWEPDIIYVHHQSSPQPTRTWIPPFADPVGFRAPPIPAREVNTIGILIAQDLDANEQIGAAHASPRSTRTIRGTSITCPCTRIFRHGGPRLRAAVARRQRPELRLS